MWYLSLVLRLGIEPCPPPPHWKGGVLTTGPSGKSSNPFFYLNVKQKMQGWAIWKFIIYLTSKSQNQFYTLPQVTEVITAEGQNIGKASLSSAVI